MFSAPSRATLASFALAVCAPTVDLSAKSQSTYEFIIIGGLSSEIAYNLQTGGEKSLPSSWDDFLSIRATNEGRMEPDLPRMRIVNSFALVPGAPVISPDLRIPREYAGFRLILINRAEVDVDL